MSPELEIPYHTLAAIQLLWMVVAVWWSWRKGDEIPLIAATFLAYISSYRFHVVAIGQSEWVNLANLGFGTITAKAALEALGYIVFGESVFLATYMLVQNRSVVWSRPAAPPKTALWLRPKLFGFATVALIIAELVSGRMSRLESTGMAMFEMSGYLYLAPMMLSSVGVFLAVLYKMRALESTMHKTMAVVLSLLLFTYTFSTHSRFQFIAWMLAGLIILTTGVGRRRRAILLGFGAVVILGIVAFAGAMRYTVDEGDQFKSSETLQEDAVSRAFAASDANMLDGFVLIQRVYPSMLNFSYGMEHIDILLRPIPRALWPGKPMGGYMNKLGFTGANLGFTLGISPSLFGSFYQEAAGLGIFFCSLLYGAAFGGIVRASIRMHPMASLTIRGVMAAAIVPLLRGGDLPGVYAWLGMSFWPCALVLWIRQRELASVRKRRRVMPRPEAIGNPPAANSL